MLLPVSVGQMVPAWEISPQLLTSLVSVFRSVDSHIVAGPFLSNLDQDSPLGVRFTDLVTSFPAGVTAAST